MNQRKTKGQERQCARMYVDRLRKSCAITVDTPKTSALVFEKVYASSDVVSVAPVEIVTYQTGLTLHSFPAISGGGPAPEQRTLQIAVRERPGYPHAIVSAPTRETLLYLLNRDADQVRDKIAETGHRPVLCYSSYKEENKTLGAGDHELAVSCIRNLGIVDEEQLSWEQVLEFRKDELSRARVGRFLHWLDFAMQGKSRLEVEDILGRLYEQNLGALRKFGIYTKEILSETFLALGQKHYGKLVAAAAAGTVDMVIALLTAGVVLCGEAAVAVRKVRAKIADADDATAFLHSVERLGPPLIPRGGGDGPVEFGGDGGWLIK